MHCRERFIDRIRIDLSETTLLSLSPSPPLYRTHILSLSLSRTHTFFLTHSLSPSLYFPQATKYSDYWALGCIIYKMLTGTSPFMAGSEYLIFQRVRQHNTKLNSPWRTP
jgi:serine/threonine protein kinase